MAHLVPELSLNESQTSSHESSHQSRVNNSGLST